MRSALIAHLLTATILLSACAPGEPAAERVMMTTSLGVIEMEIYTARAPITAANFLAYVDGGHLDGAAFYRVVSPATDNGAPVISVIQGGIGAAPAPFSPIAHETTEQTGLQHLDGTISMARGAVGSATSEFFICIGAQPALDYGAGRNPDGQGFAAFARVTNGMDVVRAIHAAPANAPTDDQYVRGQLLEQPVTIHSVRRL